MYHLIGMHDESNEQLGPLGGKLISRIYYNAVGNELKQR